VVGALPLVGLGQAELAHYGLCVRRFPLRADCGGFGARPEPDELRVGELPVDGDAVREAGRVPHELGLPEGQGAQVGDMAAPEVAAAVAFGVDEDAELGEGAVDL